MSPGVLGGGDTDVCALLMLLDVSKPFWQAWSRLVTGQHVVRLKFTVFLPLLPAL